MGDPTPPSCTKLQPPQGHRRRSHHELLTVFWANGMWCAASLPWLRRLTLLLSRWSATSDQFAWGTGTTGASAVRNSSPTPLHLCARSRPCVPQVNLVSVAGQSMTPRSAAVSGAARRVAQPSSPRSYTTFQPDLLFAGAGAPPVDVVPSFERSRARRSGVGRAGSSDESSGAGDDAGGIGLDDLASRPAAGSGTAGQGARSRSSQRINELHVNVAATPAPRPASIATAAAAWGLSEVPSTNSPRRAGAFAQHTHSSRSRRTASGERTARSTDRTNGRKPLRVWGKPKQKKGTFATASTGRGESPRKKHTKSVGGVNHTCTTPVVLSEHALEKQFARGVVTHTCTACNERQHMFAHSGKVRGHGVSPWGVIAWLLTLRRPARSRR